MTSTCHATLAALTRRLLHVPALALLLLAPAGAAHASPLIRANVTETLNNQDNTPEQTATSGSVSDAESGSIPNYGDAQGQASASFGVLRTFAQTNLTGGPTRFGNAYTVAQAGFRDDFLIDAPGLTGTAGTVTVRFTISGNLVVNTTGSTQSGALQSSTRAQAQFGFGLDLGPNNYFRSQTVVYDGTSNSVPFLGIPQEFTLNFTYGTLLQNVTLQIESSAGAASEYSNYTSLVTSDLSHTALWGGFVNVRDANGNVVNNYSFSSSSGFDYTRPVPEPGTWAMVAGGVAALGMIQRHRRRTR